MDDLEYRLLVANLPEKKKHGRFARFLKEAGLAGFCFAVGTTLMANYTSYKDTEKALKGGMSPEYIEENFKYLLVDNGVVLWESSTLEVISRPGREFAFYVNRND